MKIVFLAIILFNSALLANPRPPLQNINVYDHDNRKVLKSKNFPWSTVGQLESPDGRYCTATLIGPDLILTAGHCIKGSDKQLLKGRYSFLPAHPTLDAEHAEVLRYYYGQSGTTGADWAILRLNWRIGDVYGYMGLRIAPADETLMARDIAMITFSLDFRNGEVAGIEKGCHIRKVEYDYFLHDCAVSPGGSGGPILDSIDPKNPTDAHIIAINVAERRDGAATTRKGQPYTEDQANVAVPVAAFFQTFLMIQSGNLN